MLASLRSWRLTLLASKLTPSVSSNFSACVCAKLLQLCPTLHNPMDSSPPGFSVHGILQARILEWVACPPPGDLPDAGVEPVSPVAPALQADSLPLSYQGNPKVFLYTIIWKCYYLYIMKPSHQGVTALEEYFVVHSSWEMGAPTGEQSQDGGGRARVPPEEREVRGRCGQEPLWRLLWKGKGRQGNQVWGWLTDSQPWVPSTTGCP